MRIAAPKGTPFFASAQGAVWTVAIGPGAQSQSSLVRIVRDDVGGPAALKAVVSGTTRTLKVNDPVVGDTLSVVTALGPAKGVPTRRDYVQMAVLPSAQGLALESYVDDLNLSQTEISPAAFEQIFEFKKLKKLTINFCTMITGDAKESLQKAMPDLKIFGP